MADFVIMADTGCDLDAALRERFNIEIITAHLVYPDKKERDSFLSWDDITMEEFYKNLKKNPKGYTTAPPSVGEFVARFEEVLSAGKDLMYISVSTGLSGTFNFAVQAKDMVLAKFPSRKVEIVDSLRFGSGYGMVCVQAAMRRAEGMDLDACTTWINENKNRIHQAGWLDDLSFVAASGRMNHGKAFFGTLAGIKPFGEQDANGKTTVIAKAKGAKQGFNALVGYIKETLPNPEEAIVFIANSNRRKQAEELKARLEVEIHPKEVYVKDVFPTSGINVGPGLMSAYYVGTPISEGLKEEAAIFERLLAK